jgi:hypothetical protein
MYFSYPFSPSVHFFPLLGYSVDINVKPYIEFFFHLLCLISNTIILAFYYFYFILLLCLPTQVLLSHAPDSFCFSYFQICGVSCFLLGAGLNSDPSTSTSCIAGIIGAGHDAWPQISNPFLPLLILQNYLYKLFFYCVLGLHNACSQKPIWFWFHFTIFLIPHWDFNYYWC